MWKASSWVAQIRDCAVAAAENEKRELVPNRVTAGSEESVGLAVDGPCDRGSRSGNRRNLETPTAGGAPRHVHFRDGRRRGRSIDGQGRRLAGEIRKTGRRLYRRRAMPSCLDEHWYSIVLKRFDASIEMPSRRDTSCCGCAKVIRQITRASMRKTDCWDSWNDKK